MGQYLLEHFSRAADHVSTSKAATVGGAGSVVSIGAAAVDPSLINPWLQFVSLVVGLLVGLGSGGLVALKYWDRHKDKSLRG